ncbi:DNA cytosine methyltransferase [Salisediminibacterium halotolerans]|uniref:DNA (cytosine-5-)-methyltransferase n=1 Tax=Salisediminibacterium halotolerans TaxID=517425 RepID=A0A1H9RDB3_9BACI|nr:DNA cytosine methyltransferase [Salisediminibacterium haloalkalitolerans]SER70688.1 DNA (cytosine-5)-methyltransferase 1 [Salisediminibacterium haloalkalitolerans]
MSESSLSTSNKNDMPQVVDLFSGCGGFSYGFKLAGYSIAGGVEIDASAADTASYNLHWKDGIDRDHIVDDVRTFEMKKIQQNLNPDEPVIVIGGPPCQAYSQIGRAKLRSLGEDRIHTNDQRGMLFQDFIEAVLELNAESAVMENVLESVNYGGINIPHEVCSTLEKNGYSAKWTVLNAADFGVPQVRERVIVIASKSQDITSEALPCPAHRASNGKLTPGKKRMKKFSESEYFLYPKETSGEEPGWITVGEALSDLPVLFSKASDSYQYYPLNISFPYKNEAMNSYQKLMRSMNGSNLVTANSYRKTVRDFPIFERMEQGDNYIEASEIAEDLLSSHCEVYGIDPVKDKNIYDQERKKIVPPYSKDKFKEKWKKLNEEFPSHTLVAHLSTDTYSHIHPWEPRGISVREAARIQSFPDDFIFQCTMGDAYKQIGNAVPPLLSKALAESLSSFLFDKPEPATTVSEE